MPKLGTDTFKGKSGDNYVFNVYDGAMRFNDFIPGVYLISRQDGDNASAIYLDHSDNVDITLQKHHKKSCFEEHQFNRICFYRNASAEVRQRVVDDLMPALKPACNK